MTHSGRLLLLLAAFAYAQTGNEAKSTRTATAEKTGPQVAPGRPELAASPAGLMVPGAVEKIQSALEHEGLLHGAKPGELDDATAAAVREFQGAHGLARTGVPDHQTVRILGLKPADIFKQPAR
jgi:peptidoglycan hydrolase-like protein with peptidoglycan-binding domain